MPLLCRAVLAKVSWKHDQESGWGADTLALRSSAHRELMVTALSAFSYLHAFGSGAFFREAFLQVDPRP
jgi:hypothetical protein